MTPEAMRERHRESEALADPKREAIMKIVREALWDHGDMSLLAGYTGISVACLNALRSGRTRWPRPTTMFTVCEALGLEMQLVRTNGKPYLRR